MNVPFSPPDVGEEEINEIIEAVRSGWITTGPKTKQLEKQIAAYCHTSYAACLSSATGAMELTLRILGVGPGDEVITTAYTYTASASVICHVGATPVLVDTAPESFQMDYEQLAAKITEKTKVIIPVDLGGVVCDYDRLFKIAEEKRSLFRAESDLQKVFGRVIIMADAAHAFGARWHGRMCGEIADFTCFSFHAVKNLTTAEGGAVVWRDIPGIDSGDIYHQYMLMSLHGQSKDALAKTKAGSWEYDVIAPYYKFNMTDIMAAMGLAQLKNYQSKLDRRHEIIRRYNEGFKGLPVTWLEHTGEDYVSSGHLYLLRFTGRHRDEVNDMIEQMAEAGISVNVHYKPLPMLTAYKDLGFDIKDFPNAYALFDNEMTLPLHTCLSNAQVDYVIETVRKVLGA